MKRFLSGFFAVVLLALCLCSCSKSETPPVTVQQKPVEKYLAVTKIDPCVVEPDDSMHMTEQDKQLYRVLMNAMLLYEPTVKLSQDREQNNYYIDLLKQSPYYFFVESYVLNGDVVEFEYAYSKQEQEKMRKFIDDRFLYIANYQASKDDNELDVILKIHSAVASAMTYDSERTDNKRLGSMLFMYPEDEIYKGLKDNKGLCYAFSYTLRFALLQRGVGCFCVYGACTDRDEAHMWNVFEYNGKYYTCDATWDRKEGYPKLYSFGKTDAERVADNLKLYGFSSQFFDEHESVECVDKTFQMFRSIGKYYYTGGHTYCMVDWNGVEYTFDSQTLKLKEKKAV